MLPAILFFVCMVAFYPAIANETLPSDFLLQRLNLPLFHLLFQADDLLRAARKRHRRRACDQRAHRDAPGGRRAATTSAAAARLAIALALLACCMLLADRFGLVALIAKGYRALAAIFLIVYVLPLLTFGIVKIRRQRLVPQESP